jgi:ABC-type Zn2+ transport system substrate-binding protein/surface adhesin
MPSNLPLITFLFRPSTEVSEFWLGQSHTHTHTHTHAHTHTHTRTHSVFRPSALDRALTVALAIALAVALAVAPGLVFCVPSIMATGLPSGLALWPSFLCALNHSNRTALRPGPRPGFLCALRHRPRPGF